MLKHTVSTHLCARARPHARLQEALRDPAVARVSILEDLRLAFAGWGQSGGDPWLTVRRDVVVAGAAAAGGAAGPGAGGGRPPSVDFDFLRSIVLIGANRSVTLRGLEVLHSYKDSSIAVSPFVGAANSTLILDDVIRRRPICSEPLHTLQRYEALPRPPGYPGQQTISFRNDYCSTDRCFPGPSLHYDDVAVAVATPANELTSAQLAGYTLVLRNVTRLCLSYVTPECVQQQGDDECLAQGLEDYIAALRSNESKQGPNGRGGAIAGAVAGSVGGALLVALAGLLLARRRRRRRREKRRANGPKWGSLQDSAGAVYDWVTHQVAGEEEQQGPLPDKVQLGVLLGTGAFGRRRPRLRCSRPLLLPCVAAAANGPTLVFGGGPREGGMDVAVKVLQHDQRSSAERIQNEAAAPLLPLRVHTYTFATGPNHFAMPRPRA
ncbi:hypothetical protein MNEG_12963 [Monoraphidium neglectum]|uniref:Protein kinase domain-containing protein n=1 Tax=Monoraphidium neglectum TaxID=145388 RepID=A0A0D2LTL2_9CHLO|nr:hypothetical protein MNEG_12963 [Monoraphidium neglectum]KIY94999.1 hypothetical protein MNEG_12963 [Monoraphidium neglectum]|eukprot:XP_013894019.1 hypothetical protein MNEG_12963 [Monoraphidium neglectum]